VPCHSTCDFDLFSMRLSSASNLVSSQPRWESPSHPDQGVVARRPFATQRRPEKKASVHTEATRRPRIAFALTQVLCQRLGNRLPQPGN
jgi:hypothetical protein